MYDELTDEQRVRLRILEAVTELFADADVFDVLRYSQWVEAGTSPDEESDPEPRGGAGIAYATPEVNLHIAGGTYTTHNPDTGQASSPLTHNHGTTGHTAAEHATGVDRIPRAWRKAVQ